MINKNLPCIAVKPFYFFTRPEKDLSERLNTLNLVLACICAEANRLLTVNK